MKNNSILKKIKCMKYHQLGTTYEVSSDDYSGLIWNFKKDDKFTIEAYDLFISNESWVDFIFPNNCDDEIVIIYLFTSNGEILYPYYQFTAQTTVITKLLSLKDNILLHSNYPFRALSFSFNKDYILEKIARDLHENLNRQDFFYVLFNLTSQLESLAKKIINCKLDKRTTGLYYKSIADECISLIANELLNLSKPKEISLSDEEKILHVSMYIEDHYNHNIKQELLERISLMSKTKLKNTFKAYFGMSITEFTQRKRIDIGENLLITTDLKISEIATSVGYSSHSRFSELYKRYKGITPVEARNLKK